MHYTYRCTTEKLPENLDRVADMGDTVLWPVHVGGRDWVLICRKGRPHNVVLDEAIAHGLPMLGGQ